MTDHEKLSSSASAAKGKPIANQAEDAVQPHGYVSFHLQSKSIDDQAKRSIVDTIGGYLWRRWERLDKWSAKLLNKAFAWIGFGKKTVAKNATVVVKSTADSSTEKTFRRFKETLDAKDTVAQIQYAMATGGPLPRRSPDELEELKKINAVREELAQRFPASPPIVIPGAVNGYDKSGSPFSPPKAPPPSLASSPRPGEAY